MTTKITAAEQIARAYSSTISDPEFRAVRKYCRDKAGLGRKDNAPVCVVPGRKAPAQAGESYHWTTLGGKPIYHPGAYNWPKLYISSTRRVEVGLDWLLARA